MQLTEWLMVFVDGPNQVLKQNTAFVMFCHFVNPIETKATFRFRSGFRFNEIYKMANKTWQKLYFATILDLEPGLDWDQKKALAFLAIGAHHEYL